MYDDLLIPTDGSEAAAAAIEHGVSIASRYDATVHALYVLDETRGGGGLLGADVRGAGRGLHAEGRRALDTVTEAGETAGVEVTTTLRRDVPHEGILGYADEHGIDLIVIGTNGRSGVGRLLFGSITERVSRTSDAPVLVVRGGSTE